MVKYRQAASLAVLSLIATAYAQVLPADATAPSLDAAAPRIAALNLPPAALRELNQDLAKRDYAAAEQLLLNALSNTSVTSERRSLLAVAGAVYFAAHDDWNAAIAWKKADTIAPLEPALSFSLAMAYIRMGHPAWARDTLLKLQVGNDKDPIYPYWLGRLAYGAQDYDRASAYFHQTLQLDPSMARAYDNLGLCYYALNQNSYAVESFRKAIALDATLSAPHSNLATTLEYMGQVVEAEAELREALRLSPRDAHLRFELGNLLENRGQQEAAMAQFHEATAMDPAYPEPHFALARLYRKLGDANQANAEAAAYKRLHAVTQTP